MIFLMLRGYELCCVVLPFCAAFALLNRRDLKRRVPGIKSHALLALVFAVYLCGVFYFTEAGTLHTLLIHGPGHLANGRVSLVPFANQIDPVAYGLNVLLLVPFGFLVPLIWPAAGGFFTVALGGLGFSLLIELSQLLNNRATDVDDLIMNLLGAVLGFCLYRLAARLPGVAALAARQPPRPGWAPFFYIGVGFAGRFLLFASTGLVRGGFRF